MRTGVQSMRFAHEGPLQRGEGLGARARLRLQLRWVRALFKNSMEHNLMNIHIHARAASTSSNILLLFTLIRRCAVEKWIEFSQPEWR